MGKLFQLGQEFYAGDIKKLIERDYKGQYAVIDVEQKKYVIDPDKVVAIEKAQQAFGEKLFYIVHIGIIERPRANESSQKYAWNFL